MSSYVQKLDKQKLISPPKWLPNSMVYEVIMGSFAYGVSNDTSDVDVYGVCIPHKDMIFPHLNGEIQGFGRQIKRFDTYQEHHVKSQDGEKEYDFQVFSIIKFFQLCMDNNPNVIDALFVPIRCITHSTKIGNMIREKRKDFLHKGAWHRFKGYSYSQLHKMEIKKPKAGKRKDLVDRHGFDTKFAYHVPRLLGEVEQIMMEGDLDLERNREQLKAIRKGEWSIDDIKNYFQKKEAELETLYLNSKLPHSPDEGAIKNLLLNCLEEYYGSLDKCVVNPDKATQALKDIQNVIENYNS
jgi:predicted nucleotidyltransferase